MPLLREAVRTDATAIVAILAREIASGVAHFGTEIPSIAEIEAEIAGTGVRPFRVADHGGQAVAFARATPWKPRGGYAWTVEIGVYVAPEHQRRSLGRRLVAEVVSGAAAAGFRTLMAGIALPNPGSVALFEGLGFSWVGTLPAVGYKHGRWHDVGYWSLRVGDGTPGR